MSLMFFVSIVCYVFIYVFLVRMRITVNDQIVLNNYEPANEPPETLYNLSRLHREEKKHLQEDPSLFRFRIDEYQLPSLLIKVIKSLRPNEVIELKTSKVEKLMNNFPNHYFDQSKIFKSGDKVSIYITLVHFIDDNYFYKMSIIEKLNRIQHLKNMAGQFFKVGNFKKAAKLYQRINGYYNFGDVNNNYQKEDESSE